MYQPYPGGDQPPQQSGQLGQSGAPVPMPIPQSVTRAVQVMYLGALASLVGIIIELLTRHSLRTFIADHATRNGKRLTATQVADTYHAELVVLVVVGLIGIGLWIWMAQSNKAGKNWARITSTVFFAIDTLGAIGGLAGGCAVRRQREPVLRARRLGHRPGRDLPALAAPVVRVLQAPRF